MSLSYQRLQAVQVRDPRTILDNERQYAVLKSGQQTTQKAWTTTSISQTSIQFSCPPPSGQIIVDRKVYFLLPIRLTFSGDAGVGNLLLNPNRDAPRAFPISSSIDTIQVTINNQSVSMQMADIIQPLLHYNTCDDISLTEYSMTPTYMDQSQAYSQLYGTVRNPLASYGDSHDKTMTPRGSFPFTIVSNTQTSAVVDMVCTEPIFLSPFYWGHDNGSGFYNVNAMDFNITFLGNAGNRMWSHDASSSFTSTISSVSAQFSGFGNSFSYPQNQPYMLFTYITPLETQKLPYNMPITYPYFDIQRFPTDINSPVPPSPAANSTQTFISNNIQLSSIPRRMYIYVRERNNDLYNTPNNPDTYFSIENLSIQFQNKNGLLSSATKQQLYEMSVKNHCNMSWLQWSGGKTNTTGSLTDKFGTIGSILCIEFATDIGLEDIEAPGKLGQYLLQVTLTATNISNRDINPTMYIVVVSEGTFTIEGLGKASTNIGVISSQDILNAQQNPFIDYNDVQCVNGGNFLSGLKRFGNQLWRNIKEYTPKILDGIGKYGLPIAKTFATVAPFMGLGEEPCPQCQGGQKRGGCAICHGSGVLVGGVPTGGVHVGGKNRGGVMVGGAQLGRNELRRRMQQLDV